MGGRSTHKCEGSKKGLSLSHKVKITAATRTRAWRRENKWMERRETDSKTQLNDGGRCRTGRQGGLLT